MSSFDIYKINAQYAIFFLSLDGQYVNVSGDRVIRNLGKVINASEDAICGNGTTSTTYPTQRSPRGMTFDGGDYVNLDWSAGSPLDTQTFTVVALVQPTVPVADGRIYEIGIAGQRYSLYYDLSEGTIVWQKDDVVDKTITSGWGGAQWGQPFVVAASISPTQMRLMVNDQVAGFLTGDFRLASFNAASKAYFGQDVAGGNLYKGGLYGAAIYPFELNEAQVRECGRRFKQMRNV